MQHSLYEPQNSTGSFPFVATCSFYGTEINPPLRLKIRYEMYRGRPVFREAIDERGLRHEIELLDQSDLRKSFQQFAGSGVSKAETLAP